MISMITKNKHLIAAAFGLVMMLGTDAFAQSIPANMQAALFKKIFAFDKTLASKGGAEIAVIGPGSDEIVSAFKDAGLSVKATGDQIPAGTTVVYVMPGASSPKAQTASKGILSISGAASYAEAGKVAVGLGTEGGKPKILIHMSQLKAEGQELSADLLKLARIIQ
jgi:hypothetical protein